MKVYYEAYGCSQNIAETGMISKSIGERVSTPEDADIIVIGTCIVIGHTEHKMIRRIIELKEYGKKVVVYGCLPSALPERVPAGVIKIPTWDFERAHEIIHSTTNPMNEIYTMDAVVTIPIANGCMGSCAYCITKLARGRVRSRKPDWVIEQIKKALKMGVREIRLSGQDTAVYGTDIGKTLPELLEKIVTIEEDFRVRIGMMEPRETLKILEPLAEMYREPKIYKFLHLPVQSGDNGILATMNRGYTVSDFEYIVKKFRYIINDFLLSTDVIVGFPGESDSSIERTKKLIQRAKPEILNITRFSPRPKTQAYRWKRPSTNDVKRWSREIGDMHTVLLHSLNTRYLGRECKVLIPQRGKRGNFTGRTDRYRPVIIENAELGRFARIKITGYGNTYLKGDIIEYL